MNRLAITLCLMLCSLCLCAQDSIVTRAMMIGVGTANTYDTYLSPLEYRGANISVNRESMRMTHWRNIATQGLFGLSVVTTQNRAENADELGGTISYRQSWFYRFRMGQHWNLYAGGGVGGSIGVLYNMRNSANNPAQAQADASLHGAAALNYTWRWISVKAQVETPLVGAMFAPNYGQSYYEMFTMGDNDNNIVVTHPGNCPTVRTMLTVDFRIPRLIPAMRSKSKSLGTARVGYGADILQSTPNNLRRHTYMHTMYIGFVRHFKLIR